MTDVRDDVLPELMAGLFGRILAELSDGTLGDLRMSHVRVLAAIPPEGINVTELARRAGMTKQGCGQFVTYLSGTGHLSTAPDPDDGRYTLAALTDAGYAVVVAAAPAHVRSVRRLVLDPLTAVQVEQLRGIGDALLTTLDPDGRLTGLYDPDRAARAGTERKGRP